MDLKNVLYFYSYSNEIKIITVDNCIYTVPHSLQFWEKKLPYGNFFRCHKGYIVNLEKVLEIIPSYNYTFDLKLEKYTKTLPVGRKYIKDFKKIVCW
ncbi:MULTISPECIES: LytTR family DNA-binding domain-containing protein [unclassified Clostridium]|uniref:LytTR family DNA-binding domain-containing protein n=1 Tax=unclassified Clostridium TaxID=2614128 RepID=UPI0039C8B127